MNPVILVVGVAVGAKALLKAGVATLRLNEKIQKKIRKKRAPAPGCLIWAG